MTGQVGAAWFHLIICSSSIVCYILLHRLVSPEAAPAAMALLAPMALTGRVAPRRETDERERLIDRRAAVAGGAVAYLFVIGTCMAVWWTHYRNEPPVVDAAVLSLVAYGACVALLIGRAASVLALVRRPLAAGD